MKRLILIAVILILGACTKTETVVEEKIVEKPVEEAAIQGPGTTVNGQPAQTPTVIATGSDMEIDAGTTTTTSGIPQPSEPKPVPVADHIEPVVKTVNPAKDSQGASLSTEVSATFSEALKADSISSSTFQLQSGSGGTVSGKVRYDNGTLVAIFTPDAPLLDGETYTATFTQGVEDLAGNKMLEPYVWSFKVTHLRTIAIGAGYGTTLAVKENGSVWAWGRNSKGQLGDGTTADRNRPVRVAGLNDVIAVGGGYEDFSAALKKDGTVWTWGSNSYGQLGDGTTTPHLTPAVVPGLSNVVQIVVLTRGVAALKKDGTVWGWGDDSYGQVGNGITLDGKGTTVRQLVPAQALAADGKSPLQHIVAIAGSTHTILAIQEPDPNDPARRIIWAWGFNYFGQLGIGSKLSTLSGYSLPVQVMRAEGVPLTNVKRVFAYSQVSGAITHDGKFYLWGWNGSGQLGDGTTTDRYYPVEQTAAIGGVAAVGDGTSSMTAYVVGEDGSLWAWGSNDYLKLMEYTPTAFVTTPRRIGTISNVTAVSASLEHAAVLKKDGSVMSVGINIHGELGTGTASFYNYHPNLLSTVPAATQVGNRATVDQNGKVWVWDRNADCELTLGSHGTEIMVPLSVNISDKIVQVSRSGHHVLAVSDKGEVWAWGANGSGELGDGGGGAGQKSCTPTRVKSSDGTALLSNIVAVSAGSFYSPGAKINLGFSLALQKNPDGTTVVYAWGNNNYLQLGGTAGGFKAYPQKVAGIPGDKTVTAIAAGAVGAMALTGDGMVYGWGSLHGWGANAFSSATDMGFTAATRIAAGYVTTFVLTSDGVVHAAGTNQYGALGINKDYVFAEPYYTTFQTVEDLTDVVDIAAGGFSAVAITKDGQLWAWGQNIYGELGVGNSNYQIRPMTVKMEDGSDFNAVKAASVSYTGVMNYTGAITAVRTDGTVWDWGYLNIAPTYMVREGEPAFSGTPLTVNWP